MRALQPYCSMRLVTSYCLLGILLYFVMQVIKSGLLLEYRKDVDTFKPLAENASNLPKPSTKNVNIREYASQLKRYASADNWIVLALVDQGCVDMAVNLYVTSLEPFNIRNYLFIGQDKATCDVMRSYDLNCYVYVTDKASSKVSIYHSKDFLRKMNIRTYMILDALNLGYNVLHTDVDIIFMRNPFADFRCDDKCDVAPLWDCGAFNAGFLFIRNSLASRAMYAVMKVIADTEPKTDDQQALNRGIGKAKKTHGLKLVKLNTKKYLCGQAFWEHKKRDFVGDSPCEDCVVVHDNWIVSMEAKRYRLQEMGWWFYDGEHRHYTCPERLYLTFGTHKFIGDEKGTEAIELNALKSALAIGALLNRTVILPRFHCGKKGERECNLLHHLLVRNLEKYFGAAYRENTFLQHPLVPKSTLESNTKLMLIDSKRSSEINTEPLQDVTLFKPADRDKGASAKEIIEWFHNTKQKVLRFHSLYGALKSYTDLSLGSGFEDKLKKAFAKKGNYRQFDK